MFWNFKNIICIQFMTFFPLLSYEWGDFFFLLYFSVWVFSCIGYFISFCLSLLRECFYHNYRHNPHHIHGSYLFLWQAGKRFLHTSCANCYTTEILLPSLLKHSFPETPHMASDAPASLLNCLNLHHRKGQCQAPKILHYHQVWICSEWLVPIMCWLQNTLNITPASMN